MQLTVTVGPQRTRQVGRHLARSGERLRPIRTQLRVPKDLQYRARSLWHGHHDDDRALHRALHALTGFAHRALCAELHAPRPLAQDSSNPVETSTRPRRDPDLRGRSQDAQRSSSAAAAPQCTRRTPRRERSAGSRQNLPLMDKNVSLLFVSRRRPSSMRTMLQSTS